jgi:hypothetical protein
MNSYDEIRGKTTWFCINTWLQWDKAWKVLEWGEEEGEDWTWEYRIEDEAATRENGSLESGKKIGWSPPWIVVTWAEMIPSWNWILHDCFGTAKKALLRKLNET